jgi:hypothetical protein
VVCHLPPDGALAIIYDRCAANDPRPREVIEGLADEKRRVSIETLSAEVFDHDMTYHVEDLGDDDGDDVPNLISFDDEDWEDE